jgi:hypothetical protein
LIGYMRQDTLNKLVFFLYQNSNSEHILYNFNTGLNDTICYNAYDTSYTNSYSYFNSNNVYYREININNYFDYLGWGTTSNSWIEGFGSTLGLFTPNGGPDTTILLCFSTNGATIYPNYTTDTCAYIPVGIEPVPEIETSISPNPTNGYCTLHLAENGEGVNAVIIDITGREVQPLFTNQSGSTFNFNVGALANGIYFVKIFNSSGRIGVSKLVKE